MDRRIHYDTIKKYYQEKFDVDVDAVSINNKKTNETYDVIFDMGIDVAFVIKTDNDRYLCMDSDGNTIDGEHIYGVVNAPISTKEDGTYIFSEQDLVLHYQYEIIDNEELIKREAELYPERTSILLRGMFSKNGFSSDLTNFYVDEIIYVDEEQFTKIRKAENVDVFKAYNEKRYDPVTDGVHGVLVIGPNGDGIMVDTQGYDYARYMSYAPQIEMPINYMLMQRMREDATLEMKLYVPLKVEEIDREMGDTNEIAGEPYLREIRKKVYDFNLEDGERGLAEYFGKDNISRNKVYSIKPDVEMVRDTMMGVAVIKMTKPLTQSEIDDLKDYVTGQFSDGWGESFEQREIQVSGGEIYVHFWDSEEYYINTDEEMEQMLEQNLNKGMQEEQTM